MKETIIEETIKALKKFDKEQSKYKLFSINSARLLIGTAAKESDFIYKKQLGNGPALSYFQIEPATCYDILTEFVTYPSSGGMKQRKELLDLMNKITKLRIGNVKREDIKNKDSILQQELFDNFEFSVFIARLCYYRQNFNLIPNVDLIKDPIKRAEMVDYIHDLHNMNIIYKGNFNEGVCQKEDLAKLWKRFYNTPGGKGTTAEFIKSFDRYNLDSVIII